MKYIEKKYQQLIQDVERAYDNTCDTLKYHINELQKIIAEKDEEIEKLKGGSQLQKEIDEYNRLEAQNNMNLEDDLAAAKSKINELVADVNSARTAAEEWETRFYTLVHQYGINLDKPVEKKNVEKAKKQVKKGGRGKYERKPFVLSCNDCGILFEAKGGNAKYCPECRKARICARTKAWKAKNKSRK